MTRHSIQEACSCGATFVWTGEWSAYGERAAAAWRANHQHVPPRPDPKPGLAQARRPMRRPR